jgi:hypothetical protein
MSLESGEGILKEPSSELELCLLTLRPSVFNLGDMDDDEAP